MADEDARVVRVFRFHPGENRYSFTAMFTVLAVVIMLNLLVSLLNDLYDELKGQAKADWCRAQVGSCFDRRRLQKTGLITLFEGRHG